VGFREAAIWLAMLAAVTLAACGGGNDESAASTATTAAGAKIAPAFLAKVDAVCARANKRFAANGQFPFQSFDPLHPDSKVLPKVGEFFRPNIATERMVENQLRALGEPATGVPQWNAIRTHAIASEANAIKQVHAALASDVTGFVATVKEADRLHGQVDAEAQAAGFAASSPCAKVF
jgi:hypothetical protein